MLFTDFSDIYIFVFSVCVPLRRLLILKREGSFKKESEDQKTVLLTLGSLGISFATLIDLLAEGCETKSGIATTVFGFSTTIQKSMSTLQKKKYVMERGFLVNVQSGRTIGFFLRTTSSSSSPASSSAPKLRSFTFL